MLGLAVGDALGWPMEDRGRRVGGTAKLQPAFRFMAWQRREGSHYAPHEQEVRAGEYSDDTQLALAIARSRSIGEDWWSYFTQVELPLWTVYERGGGGATKRAAQSWLHGRAPWEEKKEEAVSRYLTAGGNGAVMRCLPHCLVPSAGDQNQLNKALDLDAIATHGHPRAILGSRLYGSAVRWALQRDAPLSYGGLVQRLIDNTAEWGQPTLPQSLLEAQGRDLPAWTREWYATVEEAIQLLRISLEGLAEGAIAVDRPVLDALGAFGDTKGAGTITAVAAIFLASRYASQPEQGLLAAAFARGADTDTVASLTAGLLGALDGPTWLDPLVPDVQDFSYIERATDALINDEPIPILPVNRWGRQDRTRLYRQLDEASLDYVTDLGPFGQAIVTHITDPQPRSSFSTTTSQFVRLWELQTESGQTIQIKRYERGRDGQPRWQSAPEPQDPPTQSSDTPPRRAKPRAGLVLEVADLARAQHFYEEIVGLELQRATMEFVSFGWLALEPSILDAISAQLELTRQSTAQGQAIRIYLSEESLAKARKQIEALGIKISKASPRLKSSAFRCCDPDGHTVEFVAHNGKPPVV